LRERKQSQLEVTTMVSGREDRGQNNAVARVKAGFGKGGRQRVLRSPARVGEGECWQGCFVSDAFRGSTDLGKSGCKSPGRKRFKDEMCWKTWVTVEKAVGVKAAADKVTRQSPAVHTGLHESGDKGRWEPQDRRRKTNRDV